MDKTKKYGILAKKVNKKIQSPCYPLYSDLSSGGHGMNH